MPRTSDQPSSPIGFIGYLQLIQWPQLPEVSIAVRWHLILVKSRELGNEGTLFREAVQRARKLLIQDIDDAERGSAPRPLRTAAACGYPLTKVRRESPSVLLVGIPAGGAERVLDMGRSGLRRTGMAELRFRDLMRLGRFGGPAGRTAGPSPRLPIGESISFCSA